MFSTINVACVGHEVQIKYKVEDKKGMVISGTFNRVVVDIRGANRMVDRGNENPRASMGAAEYQVLATGRHC
jgi:hypothetical protein